MPTPPSPARVFFLAPLPAGDDQGAASIGATISEADALDPRLSVLDLGASRGDGIFETLGVIDGRAHGVEDHLGRLVRSARMLDLPEPHLGQWRSAMERAVASLPTTGQGSLKIVLTRGIEGAGTPTAWIVARASTSDFAERRSGIRVVTLDRGWPLDIADRAPWLLAGAKTLSYAVNMAAIREAKRRGADDALFVSSDGFALEGPTSSLLVRFGETIVTPSTDGGILPGTTQAAIYRWLEQQGVDATYDTVPAARLAEADAAWFVSSVRLAAPITAIDGRTLAIDPLTDGMNAALLAR
ncbi:aminodeoxychorismate lyase [Labedella endophytica]|uniref:Aminodeoxychorismate lyase n=1 Tax=Labedella endophytica TaxID=1523160 RepID=A0A3S0V954_9MICO|nr:aminodeoxychorismate lyase [Labedella endophytica]RUQ98899.1 aminodeoxychorismate lyase [Labedella endophytica]